MSRTFELAEKLTPKETLQLRIAAFAGVCAVLAALGLVIGAAERRAPGWQIIVGLVAIGALTRIAVVAAWRKAGCATSPVRSAEPINDLDNLGRVLKALFYAMIFLLSCQFLGIVSHNAVFATVCVLVGYIGSFTIFFVLAQRFGARLLVKRQPPTPPAA